MLVSFPFLIWYLPVVAVPEIVQIRIFDILKFLKIWHKKKPEIMILLDDVCKHCGTID